MEGLTRIDAVAVPIAGANIDTGTIFPSRFLRRPRGKGYQDVLFRDRRFDLSGQPRSDFPLDQPAYRGARIIVADANFGCGSSRESAVFALIDAGFLCIIAPSYGEIFIANCFRNGLLAVSLPQASVEVLRDQLERNPGGHVCVDLAGEEVRSNEGNRFTFAITNAQKKRLMLGQDDCALALQASEEIRQFEYDYLVRHPWVLPKSSAE